MSGVLLVILIWAAPWCATFRITGYVRPDFGSAARTYDGTSILTNERIVAASWEVEMGSMVIIQDLGVFRVADRGHLGPRHIDVAVWTRAEAYEITGYRPACVFPPGF